MSLKIRKACVLGAGVMGAQIAAHLAAAGVRTYLLDLPSNEPPTDAKMKKLVGNRFRSFRALAAIEQMKSLKPAPYASASVIPNLIAGNFDDDMSVIAECDWVIEAVAEKREIKKAIHSKIAEFAPTHIPITTNTSGINVADMCENFPEHLRQNFFGTHFFNPPRYLHLVEIIPHDGMNEELAGHLSNWIAERLGKGIVRAKDTTNFIANRIGVFNLQITIKHMQELGLNIETVDALTGKFMGRPSSATFRTLDVVGLDTYAHTTKNVFDNAKHDPFLNDFQISPWITSLIAAGSLGQKSNSVGCYKKSKDASGATAILAYRPAGKSYETQNANVPAWMSDASKLSSVMDRLNFASAQSDAAGQFIWRTLRDTMVYAATVIQEIADGHPQAIDNAIRWGFNWEFGPFELWQGMGYDQVREHMKKDDCKIPKWCVEGLKFYRPVPASPEWHLTGPDFVINASTGNAESVERPRHQFNLPTAHGSADERVLLSNKGASLVNIGDGVACLTFHSKMNTLNDDIIKLTFEAIEKVKRNFDAMVIGNAAENFSAGADLRNFVKLIDAKDFKGVDQMLRMFQGAMQMIKFAPFPTVSCPHQLTLGGGCEVSLHTTTQVLSGETYAGLVEIGVGLIPAGGGTKELALRAYKYIENADKGDPMPFLQRAFQLIGMAKVSTSGHEAIEMGLYPRHARVSLSRPHQILRAKEEALHLHRAGYVAASAAESIPVIGDAGIQTFKLGLYNMMQSGFITEYEALIGEKIATVLCGGAIDGGQTVSEQYLLDLERDVFVELCQQPKTRERIEHMLKNGKPLRN